MLPRELPVLCFPGHARTESIIYFVIAYKFLLIHYFLLVLVLYGLLESAVLERFEVENVGPEGSKARCIVVGDIFGLNTAAMAVFGFFSLDTGERNALVHCKCNTCCRWRYAHGMSAVFQIPTSCTVADMKQDD